MFANRYTALIDACSLVSAPRRDLLLHLAEAEFFRLRWSPRILEETKAALEKIFVERGADDAAERAARAVATMHRAFPEALVDPGPNPLPVRFDIPDPDDEHVLASALQTQAQAIVTENLRDFPTEILTPLGIEVRTADDFIADSIDLDTGRAVAAVRAMREQLRRPEMTPEAFLKSLEAHGLLATVSVLGPHAGSL